MPRVVCVCVCVCVCVGVGVCVWRGHGRAILDAYGCVMIDFGCVWACCERF